MSSMKRTLAIILLFILAGCQTPFLVFSGGPLKGPVESVENFAFAADYNLLRLEVRPDNPYSVILRVSVHAGELYIDAAQQRRWHKYLKQNTIQEKSNVRVKLGETIYPASAQIVSDPAIKDLFLSGRTIYRLTPRAS